MARVEFLGLFATAEIMARCDCKRGNLTTKIFTNRMRANTDKRECCLNFSLRPTLFSRANFLGIIRCVKR